MMLSMTPLRLLAGRGPDRRTTRWIAGLLAVPLAVMVLSGQTVVTSAALTPTDRISVSLPVTLPNPAILTAKLKAVSTKGIKQKSIIVTTTDGQVLTTMSAVDTLGPDRTFATRTVDAGDGRVFVIGGGDPFLTDKASTKPYKLASLATLAVSTATALKATSRTTIALRYDASLFSGPLFSPKWKSKWRTYEARVAALEINSGKLSNGKAATNPAKTAANALAKRLRAAGITVTSIAGGKATTTGTELARVTSATVSTIVQRTLLVSDNVAAETLLRQAAVAKGKAGSFTAASANLRDWLVEHGLWAGGQKIYDGSGLAPASKLTTAVLAGAIRLALADPTYVPVIAGLPVAGETGTLKDRFDDKSERAGRHTVHAKTGTLSGLAGLAGYLTTADGAVLVFAELGDKATSYYRVYNWLDREASVVAGCGCR